MLEYENTRRYKGIKMEKRFEKAEELTEEIYNLSLILKRYCEYYLNESESFHHVCTLVKYLHKNIDKLSCTFANHEID